MFCLPPFVVHNIGPCSKHRVIVMDQVCLPKAEGALTCAASLLFYLIGKYTYKIKSPPGGMRTAA